MVNNRRDDFSLRIKNILAKRVAYICSNPNCNNPTVGPSSTETKTINIGVAAHICAAAPGGPRYDNEMTSEERSSVDNGIWLCQNCSKLIDSDVKNYPIELLKEWKKNAEAEAEKRLSGGSAVLLSERGISGWKGYCNWSNLSTGEKPYIIKENSFIYKDGFDKINRKQLLDGIDLMRKKLSKPRNSLRLAGLSGTGKTRLAQALFDNSIGESPLDKSIVIYGDISDMPKPDPIEYIQKLVDSRKRIILIVDNCEPTMHNKLTKLCQVIGSNVSLLTIEYDVKEDDNVNSENFYLGSTSPGILREMLKRDFDYITDANIDTIVRCSDGNYRIALYLAKSIDKNYNIGILKDNELFERLFYQCGKVDDSLMKVGMVCSLFYSFNINYEDVDPNEIKIISDISNVPAIEVVRYVETLRKRQIIQKRGDMRAVLPHALANRLADEYIEKYPVDKIIQEISHNNRLLISFFRRLKNLHNNEKALKIADEYLTKLSDDNLINSSDLLIEILKCINILHPSKLLYRINNITDNQFFTRDNPHFYDWVLMLANTAYDKEYFQPAVENIIKFALSENENTNLNSIHSVLYNLFHIYLSCTHASLETRIAVIDDLIYSEKEEEQILGVKLLEQTLEYGHTFYGSPIFDNGTKNRDYGLVPKPKEWFNEVFDYIDKLLDENILYDDIKGIVANQFVDLYRNGFGEALDKLVRKNLSKSSWPSIWLALLTMKRIDKDKIPKKYMKMINDLIILVKPSNIKEKLYTYLYGGRRVRLGLDVAYDDFNAVNNMVYELGKEIGCNDDELNENLKVINNDYDLFRVDYLAKGIYDSNNDKENLIYTILDNINDDNERAMKFMINSIISLYHNEDENRCNIFLDDILENERYNMYFMSMQLSYDIDKKSLERILKALEQGLIDDSFIYRIESYTKKLNSEQIISLFEKVKTKTKNGNVIIDSLYHLSELDIFDDNLKKYSRITLCELNLEEYNNNGSRMNTYPISELIKKVFNNNDAISEVKIIFNKIRNMLNKESVSFYELHDILEPLIKTYPQIFLDIFIDYDRTPSYPIVNFFKSYSGLRGNIINLIPCDKVISWLMKSGKDVEISYLLEAYKKNDNGLFDWNELAVYLFDNYSNIIVVQNLVDNIYPRSWDKNYSEVLEERKSLLLYLKNIRNTDIKKIAKKEMIDYQLRFDYWLEREKKEREEDFERFE